jgi:hypothetical protein
VNLKLAPFCFTPVRDIGYFFLRHFVPDFATSFGIGRLNSRYPSFYRPSSSPSALTLVASPETGKHGGMTGGVFRRIAVLVDRSWIVVTIRRTFYEIPFKRAMLFTAAPDTVARQHETRTRLRLFILRLTNSRSRKQTSLLPPGTLFLPEHPRIYLIGSAICLRVTRPSAASRDK